MTGEAKGPGGSKIYRHTERMQQLRNEGGESEALIEAIIAHMTAQVGAPARVLHERLPSSQAIDIHIVPPGDEPVLTLFTTGMSEHPMTMPAGVPLPRRAELILRLPETWPITEEALTNPRTSWPIQWLRTLARLPRRYGTWLAPTHTIPNGEPPQPLSVDTRMCCMFTVPPICVEDKADVLETPRGPVMLISVVPIYEAEMRFKLERGADALIERMAAAGCDDVVDVDRAPVCAP
jgi:hypothetical protein